MSKTEKSLKSVLITGTSAGGIGSAIAFEYQERGYRVFATVRNTKKLDPELVKLKNVEVLELDVTSPESISAAAKALEAQTGGTLDVLVNNSGAGYTIPILDMELEKAKSLFDVNFFGLLAVTKAFAPLVIKSKGTIVNIGSIAGDIGLPFQGLYNASKSAVHMASECLRLELKPFGVRVITTVVGVIKTKFFDNVPVTKLPEGSVYLPIKDGYEGLASGASIDQDSATPAPTFAKKLVGDVERGASGKVARGNLSSIISWTLPIVPTFIWDIILSRRVKLNQL